MKTNEGDAVTLDEAIHQQIELGQKDPLTIARNIAKLMGEDWLREEVAARAEDFVTTLARHALGSQRRSSEIALRAGDQIATSELKLRSYWVPGEGYKPAHELTADDLRARASWYDGLAIAASRRAEWCRDVAGLMDAEGAKTLGRLKASLPPLPDEADLALAPT